MSSLCAPLFYLRRAPSRLLDLTPCIYETATSPPENQHFISFTFPPIRIAVIKNFSSLCVLIFGCIFVITLYLYRRRNRKVTHNNHFGPPKIHEISLTLSLKTFTYDELEKASDKFFDMNLLAEGGVGCVHKGVLPNGEIVAVKELKSGSIQGEFEFHAKVEVINRIHHRHLVSLDGQCISSIQRVLVYELFSNETLHFHLHGKDKPTMDWSTMMKIAIGSAKGLAYLHEDLNLVLINITMKMKLKCFIGDKFLNKHYMDHGMQYPARERIL